MKRLITTLLCLLTLGGLQAQTFSGHFADRTLRADYILSGNARQQRISLDALASLPTWAGRRNRLGELPHTGNGQATVRDAATGQVLYRTSFSSLFQEWLATDEAQHVDRAYEHTVLLPWPLNPVEVEIVLLDARHEVQARLVHRVDPHDELIRSKGSSHVTPHRQLLLSGAPDRCIDVAILAEGYTAEEMERFYLDAGIACESLFDHEPFRSLKGRFNIVAAASSSADSGVSIPRLATWRRTAFGSHFSTFYSDRYLTTPNVKAVHDALAGIPYEHIIILANTDEYGGGGIYNAYTLTTAHHAGFRPVVVHEFGHSFGGLADEYFYDNDIMNGLYPLDIEPWEPNITTCVDFAAKWQDILADDTPRPTPVSESSRYPVGLYEGGGYSSKGIYRPADDCRMRTNTAPAFCPACQRALRRLIEFYTG